MSFKLGTNIKVGQKVLLKKWEKVLEVTDSGIITNSGITNFGDEVNGWRFK